MADKVITSTGDCSACCEPPADCPCALLIPPFAAPYADYATAVAAIADQTDNCIGYIAPAAGDTIDSFTADNATADTVILTGEVSDAGDDAALTMYCSVSLKAGSTLTVAFDVTSTDTDPETDAENSVIFQLFNCDGTGLDTQTDSSTDNPFTGTFTYSVVSDGEYIVLVNAQGRPLNSGGQTVLAEWTISSDDTLWVNPVIALWDDSGTTRQLEACPKMLLPPLTESTGDWYADCASAESAISGNPIAGCEAFFDQTANTFDSGSFDGDSYSASFSGSTEAGVGAYYIWWSVNLVAGDTATISYSLSGTTDGNEQQLTASVYLYDDTGTLLLSVGESMPDVPSISGSDGITVPYTGRYIVRVLLGAGPTGEPALTAASGSGGISSSGAMTTNPIQALYEADPSLACPGRLDCGDACP